MSGPISATRIATPSPSTTSSGFGPGNDRHRGEAKMKLKMIALAALLFGSSAAQADIVRTPIPNSTFPIAQTVRVSGDRSEEHTSELQSHSDLVCRLLLD